MIPDFDANGNLPPGIHVASLQEVEERFAIFDRSDRRLRLFQHLKRVLTDIRQIAFVTRIFIAGSFVTSAPEPNDFDCLIVLDPETVNIELRPFEYQVLNRRTALKTFEGDVIAVLEGSAFHDEYLKLFQHDRKNNPKGLVEILE